MQSAPPFPGTAAYFPSIITRIRIAHPDVPLDPIILQSLLLCLIAADTPPSSGGFAVSCRNLILRTREEDVGLVASLAALTLSTAFGLATHKSKLSAVPPPIPNHTRRTPTARRRASSSSISAPRPALSSHNPTALLRTLFFPTPRRSHVRRSSTLPAFIPSLQSPPIVTSASTKTVTYENIRERPFMPRVQTDPLPLQLDESAMPTSALIREESGIPRAVVVTGLEYAGMPAQRTLSQVLADRRIVLEDERTNNEDDPQASGTWNLPDDFIMVYVCPLHAQERPNIFRGLLDKFAMSVEISIPPATRLAYATFRTSHAPPTPRGSPFSSPPSALLSLPSPPSTLRPLHQLSPAPSETPSTPHRRVPTPVHSRQPSHSSPQPSTRHLPASDPAIPVSELAELRTLAAHTVIHPTLHNYVTDLFAAARHHPVLDGTLLTRRAHADAAALVRAHRVVVGDASGVALVQFLAASGDGRESDVETTTSGWEEMYDGRARGYLDVETEGPSVLVGTLDEFGVESGTEGGRAVASGTMDVSEVDIARIFPRVVSHRLRVRDGADDEVLGSVMFPAAVPDEGDGEKRLGGKAVKDVLVGILADV